MNFKSIKTMGMTALAAVIGLGSLSSAANAVTKLTVYTAVEPEELVPFANAFEKDNPDIKIQWVRDSTGIITAKLLAEGENSNADIVWGLAATSLLIMEKKGMLYGYKPKGVEKLSPNFYDSKPAPMWVGMRAWIASVCVNTYEAEKKGLPIPTTWQDLTKPVYKGHVVMPHPASSGTGYLDVSSWMQIWGEEGGWKYMDALHENIGIYTHSGSKPCKMAGKGEFPIGISFAFKGAQLKSKGAPLAVIAPTEGVGWELESFALLKASKNQAAAKRLADWSVTHAANLMYNEAYAVVAMPGVAKPVKNMPEGLEAGMIKNDFLWAADNRARILKEWDKRYGSKAAPK